MELRTRRPSPREGLVALAMVLGANAIGSAPSLFVSTDTTWFEQPWFYPPGIVFPIAWTLLFTLIGLSAFLVWRRGVHRRDVRVALAALVLQFVPNVAWTPAFFGLQRPDLGLVVIAILWIAIVGTIAAVYRVSRPAAALLVPYLAWVSFAAALTYAIYAGGS